MKSICFDLFSAVLASFQAWDSKIHVRIKFGEQPFPSLNNINLKVPWSPVGFFQKTILISADQDLIGKNASGRVPSSPELPHFLIKNKYVCGTPV